MPDDCWQVWYKECVNIMEKLTGRFLREKPQKMGYPGVRSAEIPVFSGRLDGGSDSLNMLYIKRILR